MEYRINFIEYDKILEQDGRPYEMLLNPMTLEQLKEGFSKEMYSYIDDDKKEDFLKLFLETDLKKGEEGLVLEKSKENIYIAIRYIGGPLPEILPKEIDFSNLVNDIEIYFVTLLESGI